MDPLIVMFGGLVAFFFLFALLLGWHPRRGRQLVGELRSSRDYKAIAEIEAHDIEEMLDEINEHRRRTRRRAIGEEMADELMRGDWEPH